MVSTSGNSGTRASPSVIKEVALRSNVLHQLAFCSGDGLPVTVASLAGPFRDFWAGFSLVSHGKFALGATARSGDSRASDVQVNWKACSENPIPQHEPYSPHAVSEYLAHGQSTRLTSPRFANCSPRPVDSAAKSRGVCVMKPTNRTAIPSRFLLHERWESQATLDRASHGGGLHHGLSSARCLPLVHPRSASVNADRLKAVDPLDVVDQINIFDSSLRSPRHSADRSHDAKIPIANYVHPNRPGHKPGSRRQRTLWRLWRSLRAGDVDLRAGRAGLPSTVRRKAGSRVRNRNSPSCSAALSAALRRCTYARRLSEANGGAKIYLQT